MKREDVIGTGVSGLRVEFNLTELVVLKSRIQSINAMVEGYKNGKYEDPFKTALLKYDTKAEMLKAVKEVVQFVENMVPEKVMSLWDAEHELFKAPDKKELHSEYPQEDLFDDK